MELLSFLAKKPIIALIIIVAIIIVVFQSSRKEKSHALNQPQEIPVSPNKDFFYSKKPLMSGIEIKFHNAFEIAVNNEYIVLPQVNLGTIIQKNGKFKYHNELFRNIDFCIFDKSYFPLLLIEINDETHNRRDRIERDKKVKEISASAGLPLITLHTKYGINQEYITKRLMECLKPQPKPTEQMQEQLITNNPK